MVYTEIMMMTLEWLYAASEALVGSFVLYICSTVDLRALGGNQLVMLDD